MFDVKNKVGFFGEEDDDDFDGELESECKNWITECYVFKNHQIICADCGGVVFGIAG